jgi:rSAM/selenodomain-associated transferase 1
MDPAGGLESGSKTPFPGPVVPVLAMNGDYLLIIFLKEPVAGRVKTRWGREISDLLKAELYRAIVEDILDQTRSSLYQRHLFCWPPSGLNRIRKWLGEEYLIAIQEGDDLGRRMHNAFHRAFKQGYERVVLVGTDIPHLQAKGVEEAFRALDENDLCVGPSMDGGYYLIGMKRLISTLFHNIPWSTDKVFALTELRASEAGIRLVRLPVMRDLDTFPDLEAFWNKAARSSVLPYPARRTLAALEEVFNKRRGENFGRRKNRKGGPLD